MIDLSIIIINYNNPKLTKDVINSIITSQNKRSYEIIIVNNCDDMTLLYDDNINKEAEKSTIKVLESIKNKGFGNGCNYGVVNSTGKNLLFLNNDTLIKDDALDKCLDILSEKDIAVVGVKTILPDNTLDHGCKRGFPTPLSALCYYSKLDKIFPYNNIVGAYRQTFVNQNEITEVDAVSGSFLMIKRQVFEEIKGFDEDYFMYGEDLDLCYKVKKTNYKVIYNGQNYIYHLKGQSGLSSYNPKTLFHFYDAMRIFYKKHYEKKYNKLVTWLVYKGIDTKYKMASKQINK